MTVRKRAKGVSESWKSRCGMYSEFKEDITQKISKLKTDSPLISEEDYVNRLEEITNLVSFYLDNGKWVNSTALRSLHITVLRCKGGCEYQILYDTAVMAFDMLVGIFKYKVHNLITVYDRITKKYSEDAALKTLIVLYYFEMSKNRRGKNNGEEYKKLTPEAASRLSYYRTDDDAEFFPDGEENGGLSLHQLTGYKIYDR